MGFVALNPSTGFSPIYEFNPSLFSQTYELMRIGDCCFVKKLLGLVCILATVTGCAGASINVMNVPNKPIITYKTAYVKMLPVDEFNLGAAVIEELTAMGFQVVVQSATVSPLSTDMKVEYSYTTGWDMARFLNSFNVVFSDAQTGAVLSMLSYDVNRPTLIKFGADKRIRQALKQFRESQ